MLRWPAMVFLFAAVMLGQQPPRADLTTPSVFQISGVLVDAAGNQPLPGARVAIAPVTERDAFTTVITGEDGRFSFPGLAAGKYALTAQHRGYLAQSFNQHGQFSSSIAVGPELDSTHLVFAIFREGGISGLVTDEQGEAVRDAHVMLFRNAADDGILRTMQYASAMTDDEGRYHFSHLRPGKYFVAVSAEPWYAQHPQAHIKVTDAGGAVTNYSGGVDESVLKNAQKVDIEEATASPLDVVYPITFYGGAIDSASATSIVLGKGEKNSADISLQPVPSSHWRINSGSDPQPGYVLLEQQLFDSRIEVPAVSSMVRPGVEDITALPPGHFTANLRSVKGEGMGQQELEVGGNGVVEKGTAAAAVPLVAVISVQPPAALSGQISLQLREKNSNGILRENINGKGEIEFKQGIRRGTYEISVQGGRDIYLRSIQATGARIAGRILEIKGNAPVRLNLTLAAGRGDIAGVALRGEKPAPGAMVVLVPADPGNNQLLFRRDQSDSDGTFGIADVVPGRYTLLAIADGWDLEWANPAVLQRFMAQGEPLTVESKGKYSVKVKVQ
jgi:protocatechuate 3,4-dioxygenase beta subunit